MKYVNVNATFFSTCILLQSRPGRGGGVHPIMDNTGRYIKM